MSKRKLDTMHAASVDDTDDDDDDIAYAMAVSLAEAKAVAEAVVDLVDDDPEPEPCVQCLVCLEDLNGGGRTPAKALPCGHVFHVACVDKWFETCQKPQCPVCRKVVTARARGGVPARGGRLGQSRGVGRSFDIDIQALTAGIIVGGPLHVRRR
jgi:hypothetical protein